MIKSLKAKNYYKLNEELLNHPDYQEAAKNGVRFTSIGEKLSEREESFYSRFLQDIPGLGTHFIAPSERAFNAFGNNLKLKVYSSMKKDAEQFIQNPRVLGMPVKDGSYSGNKIADYINMMTGRGNIALTMGEKSQLGEDAARFLNLGLFSPRYLTSKLQMFNPRTYTKMDAFTRKQAIRDLASLATFGTTTLGLAHAAGAEVQADPRKPGFGNIKTSRGTINPIGSFAPLISVYAKVLDRAVDPAAWGYGDKKEKTSDNADLTRFARSKVSPAAGAVANLAWGKDFVGQNESIPETLVKGFAPMLAKDIWEASQNDSSKLPLAAAGGLFGVRTSSRDDKKKSGKKGMFSSPFAK
jgi:hypothetical protein